MYGDIRHFPSFVQHSYIGNVANAMANAYRLLHSLVSLSMVVCGGLERSQLNACRPLQAGWSRQAQLL